MVSSQPKKRFYLAVGLMVVLVLALLYHAGQYLQGSRSPRKEASRRAEVKTPAMQPQPVVVTKKLAASAAGEAHAAGRDQTTVVRKKLPPMPPPPAQKAESRPAVASPSPEPAAVVKETPQQPPPPEPAAAAVAVPSAPEISKELPQRPVAARPPEPASPPAAAAPPPAVQAAPAPSPGPEPAKTVAQASLRWRGTYPFSLLLSSNRGKENALTTLPDYRRKGLAPYLVQTDLGEKGKWWRTLYGYYPSPDDALQAKKALNLVEAVVVKTPFANLVGEYPSEKEATEAAVQLSRKGLFPYTVKGPQNQTWLVAGAFPTQQAAEQQQLELEAQGVPARTIRR
jgi:hypothetical protein